MVPDSKVVQGGASAVEGFAVGGEFAPAEAMSDTAVGELRASLALVQLLALNSIFEVAQSAELDSRPVDKSVRRLFDSARSASVGVDALARAWAGRRTHGEGSERGADQDATRDGAWLQLLVALAKGSAAPQSRRELAN